jgi:hypothetical protein
MGGGGDGVTFNTHYYPTINMRDPASLKDMLQGSGAELFDSQSSAATARDSRCDLPCAPSESQLLLPPLRHRESDADLPQKPAGPVAGSTTRRPKHSVELQAHQSGGEVRLAYWSEPLWEWDISYNLLRDGFRNGVSYDELKQIEGMFLACSGTLQGFQFCDPDDSNVVRQPIGTTDGLSSAYTLVRRFGSTNPRRRIPGQRSHRLSRPHAAVQPLHRQFADAGCDIGS